MKLPASRLRLTPSMTPAAASAAAVARRRLLEASSSRVLWRTASALTSGWGSEVASAAARNLRRLQPLSTMPLGASFDEPNGLSSSGTDAVNGASRVNGAGRVNGTATVNGASRVNGSTPAEPKPERFGGLGGRIQRPIYVSATKQHTGKTTTSMALISGLTKRFDRVGFLKPVGQVALPVPHPVTGEIRQVDKDAVLIKSHFGLHHMDGLEHGGYGAMSPVIIGKGYTRDYVDGLVCPRTQLESIRRAYESVRSVSDVVLCEGTGHCAVGSVVGASNARVAAELGADMVLVANGGLGSTFDELELNRVLCEAHGVDVAGVIVNKVRPDNYESTKDYLSRALHQAWGVPLLGCIPDRPFLGCPALSDLERLFDTELLNGRRHRFRHYRVPDINLVTTSLGRFLQNVRHKPRRTLYVSHVTRDDIILGFLGEYSRLRARGMPFEAALLLCGREGKYDVCPQIKDILSDPTLGDVPVMIARMSTREAMDRMHDLTPKLNTGDTHRVEIAVEHYEPYIDFDLLLERTSEPMVSASEAEGDSGDETEGATLGAVSGSAAGAPAAEAAFLS